MPTIKQNGEKYESTSDNLNFSGKKEWIKRDCQAKLKDLQSEIFYKKENNKIVYNLSTVEKFLKETDVNTIGDRRCWAEVVAVQTYLEAQNIDIGTIDGVRWPKTATWIKKFAAENPNPSDDIGKKILEIWKLRKYLPQGLMIPQDPEGWEEGRDKTMFDKWFTFKGNSYEYQNESGVLMGTFELPPNISQESFKKFMETIQERTLSSAEAFSGHKIDNFELDGNSLQVDFENVTVDTDLFFKKDDIISALLNPEYWQKFVTFLNSTLKEILNQKIKKGFKECLYDPEKNRITTFDGTELQIEKNENKWKVWEWDFTVEQQGDKWLINNIAISHQTPEIFCGNVVRLLEMTKKLPAYQDKFTINDFNQNLDNWGIEVSFKESTYDTKLVYNTLSKLGDNSPHYIAVLDTFVNKLNQKKENND